MELSNINNKKCIYQTDQPKINEARCIIPLILRPKYLEMYCSTGCGSWFCEYRGMEKECPIVKIYKEYVKGDE